MKKLLLKLLLVAISACSVFADPTALEQLDARGTTTVGGNATFNKYIVKLGANGLINRQMLPPALVDDGLILDQLDVGGTTAVGGDSSYSNYLVTLDRTGLISYSMLPVALRAVVVPPPTALEQLDARGTTTVGGNATFNKYLVKLGTNGLLNPQMFPPGTIGAINLNRNQTVYVDPSFGSDTSGTGAPNLPYRTVAKALNVATTTKIVMIAPGDVIGGTITNANVTSITLTGAGAQLTTLDALSWSNDQSVAVRLQGLTLNTMTQRLARNLIVTLADAVLDTPIGRAFPTNVASPVTVYFDANSAAPNGFVLGGSNVTTILTTRASNVGFGASTQFLSAPTTAQAALLELAGRLTTNEAGLLAYTGSSTGYLTKVAFSSYTNPIANGATAYAWGNHATNNYQTGTQVASTVASALLGVATGTPLYVFAETDPVWILASTGYTPLVTFRGITADVAKGVTAYTWGNHATNDYQTYAQVLNAILASATNGTSEVDPIWTAASTGYTSLVTFRAVTNAAAQGAAAYAWGNHATNDYQTYAQVTNAITSALTGASGDTGLVSGVIQGQATLATITNASNGRTFYLTLSGIATGTPLYVFAETDPVWTAASTGYTPLVTFRGVTTDIAYGTAAYAWGNHATNDYQTYAQVTAAVANAGAGLTTITLQGQPDVLAITNGPDGRTAYLTVAGVATGTPLYTLAELDPVWSEASTGYVTLIAFNDITNAAAEGATAFTWGNHAANDYQNGIQVTGAIISAISSLVIVDTNAIPIGGAVMTGPITNTAGFFGNGAGLTNTPQSDTNAMAWINANGVAYTSNNTFAANTLLTASRLAASNTTITASGNALTIQNNGAAHAITIAPTGSLSAASITIRSSQTATRPVIRYGDASADNLMISAGGGTLGISSRRDMSTYGNWGNQVTSGVTDTGINLVPGRAFAVSRAIPSQTAGDVWLLFDLDPATSYSGSYILLNGGRTFRNMYWYGVTSTLFNVSFTNMTGAWGGTLTTASNTVISITTNTVNTTYTNGSIRFIGYASITLTNDGTGYAAAGFEVGGRVLARVQVADATTNMLFMCAPVSAGQTWSITNLSSGGSIGCSILTQGRE